MIRLLLLPFAIAVMSFAGFSQVTDSQKRACDERAKNVAKTLPAEDYRRISIERGDYGDCIHKPWMDGLIQFDIKHVRVGVDYESDGKGKVKVKVSDREFYDSYLSKTPIKDKKTLEAVATAGVNAMIDGFISNKVGELIRGKVANGEYEIDLADDEALPLVWLIIN